ncbi:hypothetical protein HCJ70_16370 [Listeria booriae]|uniref:hypothetical protein n=1 Tax=Listeria booriae TaxID=1552123 RepID=UPI0016234424|nr:hypothetical protein [Listeria booriae]MBC2100628.1 hypothetical protein [Listeria booriae]
MAVVTVKKDAKVLNIDESEQDFFLAKGFDVVELDKSGKKYNIKHRATENKLVDVSKLLEVEAKADQLKNDKKELQTANKELEKQNEELTKQLEEALTALGNKADDKAEDKTAK